MARRAAAARTFSAWAHRTGLLADDVARRWPALGPGGNCPPCCGPTRPPLSWRPRRGSAGGPPGADRSTAHPEGTGLRRDHGTAAEPASAEPASAEPADAVLLRDRLLLELLYGTGVRVSEACGLNVTDVDQARRVVRVLGKGGRERSVPLRGAGPAGARHLAARRPAHSADPGLGPGTAARSPGRAAQPDHRAADRVRLGRCRRGTTGHAAGLRHSAATHLLEGGADLRAVQSCWGTPRSPAPRSTRTSRWSGSAPRTARPTPAPDRRIRAAQDPSRARIDG
ncbi:tyrosine-type recombinase/integrase [Micromonospora sp. BRA006-A]|nr:tyrosine-type recombinase/integrase [Micromonospora sp. BRA006-A]